jgi:hypothetical protein
MGVGPDLVNGTISSSNLLNTAGALALSLASAFGTVELNKYATSQGSFLINTGDPSHPVAAIPGSQVALQQQQQQLQQQSLTTWIVIGFGGLLLGLVVLSAIKK